MLMYFYLLSMLQQMCDHLPLCKSFQSINNSQSKQHGTLSEMPTTTDYPQSLRKIAKIFSFLRTTESSNFSMEILFKKIIRNVAKKALNKKI